MATYDSEEFINYDTEPGGKYPSGQSPADRIQMLRDNLDQNEVNFNEGRITREQYTNRKMDARRAIYRIHQQQAKTRKH